MKYRSVFDIIGPVMVGPSSSHTAGAARIGRIARGLFACQPKKAIISFYGSFAKTYKGHGTDLAIVAGLLDFDTFDERIRDSLNLAKKEGMEVVFQIEEAIPEHPNTVKINLFHEDNELELIGISIGGGTVEITEVNNFKLKLSGNPAILIHHFDHVGVISSVTTILSNKKINISHMEVARKEKGKKAMMVIEVDEKIDQTTKEEVKKIADVINVMTLVE